LSTNGDWLYASTNNNHGKPLEGMPFFRRVKTDSRQLVSRLAQYLRDLIGNNPVMVIDIYQ
jgi:hypothetical protein